MNDGPLDTLYRLEICGRHVGFVRPEHVEKLVEKAPDCLCRTGPRMIAVVAENLTAQELTERFAALHERLAVEGVLPKPVKEVSDVHAANRGDDALGAERRGR